MREFPLIFGIFMMASGMFLVQRTPELLILANKLDAMVPYSDIKSAQDIQPTWVEVLIIRGLIMLEIVFAGIITLIVAFPWFRNLLLTSNTVPT